MEDDGRAALDEVEDDGRAALDEDDGRAALDEVKDAAVSHQHARMASCRRVPWRACMHGG